MPKFSLILLVLSCSLFIFNFSDLGLPRMPTKYPVYGTYIALLHLFLCSSQFDPPWVSIRISRSYHWLDCSELLVLIDFVMSLFCTNSQVVFWIFQFTLSSVSCVGFSLGHLWVCFVHFVVYPTHSHRRLFFLYQLFLSFAFITYVI